MRKSYLPALSLVLSLTALASFAPGCSSKTVYEVPNDGGVADGGGGGGGGGKVIDSGDTGEQPLVVTGKLDLLFMIDNSSSMGDKQEVLRRSAVSLVTRLVNPFCLDDATPPAVVGQSVNGQCMAGTLEFKPLTDIHIGVVTSSLGGRGGDQCAADAKNPTNPTLLAHNDDQAHLVTRGGADEHPVLSASQGFLTWAPTAVGQDPTPLLRDVQDIISGVHEYGCGFEAQLESVYRFLVQPDPYAAIERPTGTAKAQLTGVDETVLKQRAAFLRPDSTVAVVMLTDENESTVDPLAVNSQAWAFENSSFPGSSSGTAARGSATCDTNPTSLDCTSCAFAKDAPGCTTPYYDDQDDNLNIRFFHPRKRFGVEVQFPISRYVRGFGNRSVPNRDGEHPADSEGYVGNGNCVNPLFAKNLPTSATADLCHLTPGPRSPQQVFFALIGGVPHNLLSTDGSAAGPLKSTLSAADWEKIFGRDPIAYDFTGADPHMLESLTPRAGLPAPTSSDTADPISGREWDTAKKDLQYACTFDLPTPKDCTQPASKNACDCDGVKGTPLCESPVNTTQVRGKAYPSIRQLAVAKGLGPQAVVASVCALHILETTPGDPLFGYRPLINNLVTKLRPTLEK